MRWFVEVSSVDGAVASDKYCVEAKQWQAALQEARRIRGESGPLSKFSIELMDDGYRAVDPAAQLRYVVNKAPANTVLSEKGSLRPPTTGAPPRRTSAAPPAQSPALPSDVSVPKHVAPPEVALPQAEVAASPPVTAPAAENVASPQAAPVVPHDVVPPPQAVAPAQAAAGPAPPAGKISSRAPEKPARPIKPQAKARTQPGPGAGAPAKPAAASEASAGPIRPMAVHVVGDTPSKAPGPVGAGPTAAPAVEPTPPPPLAAQPMALQPVVIQKSDSPPAVSPHSSADIGMAGVEPTLPVRHPATSQAQKRAPRPGTGNGAGVMADPIPATEPMPSPPVSQPPKVARAAIVVPSDQVPPPPQPPRPSAPPPAGVQPLSALQPVQPVPARGGPAALPGPSDATSARPTQPSIESVSAPDFTLVRKREEEPRPNAPITYREYAYAVHPGTDRKAAEVLLWQRFRELSNQIAGRPKGKFIQLAVFDHVFEKRPLRAPIASLAWKDWRGDPVIQFASDIAADTQPAASYPPPPNPGAAALAQPAAPLPAAVPVPVPLPVAVPVAVPVPVPEPAAFPVQPAPEPAAFPVQAVPVPEPAAFPVQPAPEPAAFPVQPAPEPAAFPVQPAPEAAALPVQPAAEAVEAPPRPSQSVTIEVGPEVDLDSADIQSERPQLPADRAAPDPTTLPAPTSVEQAGGSFAAAPAAPGAVANEPRTALRSDPMIRRRRLGEDLISQLFESMHELHFMRDIVSGAEFVLGVLNDMLPCELTLIHVFDINTGQFVLVRANGPGSDKLVLYRTPDQDPLFSQAMRRLHAIRVDDATSDERFTGGRWNVIAVKPRQALCGGVKQGGRYLGAFELINPAGGETFYESEANALDYICEQFAEFLANRPIVLDAEVVLSKG